MAIKLGLNFVNHKLNFFNIIVIFSFAWFLQSYFLFNSDVSWLVHAAGRLLAGGSYAQHFLETNPPLILYLYSPVAYLASVTQFPVDTILRIYVFVLAGLSLLLCSRLAGNLFDYTERSPYSLFLLSLSVVFLILPLSDFGQREHLSLIFIFPYLLLMSLRLENKLYFNPAIIGIAAAIGFCIKPFFLLVYAFIELYYCYRKKSVFAYFRLENIFFVATVFCYLGLIAIFHQDYLNIILPLITPTYYTIYTDKLINILTLPGSVFCYLAFTLYALRIPNMAQATLETILFLAAFGFWLVFAFQRTNWYYHELPALSLSVLLITLLFNSWLSKPNLSIKQYLLLTVIAAVMARYFFSNFMHVNIPYPFYLSAFFCWFGCVFGLVLSHAYPSRSVALVALIGFIILSAAAFYHYLLLTIWQSYKISLTVTLLFLMLANVLPHKKLSVLTHWLLLTIFGLVIYAYPFYRAAFVANYSAYYRGLYQQLIARMQPFTHQKSYYFTNTSELSFPLTDYTHQHYVSRFWSFVWLPMSTKPQTIHSYTNFYTNNKTSLDIYINYVVDDFKQHTPDVVFVDDRANSKKFYYGTAAPDFLRLFQHNVAFQTAWKDYEYKQLMDIPPLCRFKVYSRKSLSS